VHREAYGDMGRVIEWWGGIGGHGQGQAEVGRHTGTWSGSGRGDEAYGGMGRVRERWGGVRGHGESYGVMGRVRQ